MAGTDGRPDRPGGPSGSSPVEDASAVTFLQKMLQQAVALRASDLHFEPYEFHYRVRFRIDGELREIASPPLVSKTPWPRASRSFPGWILPKSAFRKTAASSSPWARGR